MVSAFSFVHVHLLHYKYHKINLNRREPYINSPTWMKTQKTMINPINKNDNKCFHYAKTLILNKGEIAKDSQELNFF